MSFPFNVYLLAFAGAWLTAFISLPLWRNWCTRVGLVDDPGHRKIHDLPIPLAGGLAIITAVIVPTLLGAIFLGWRGMAHAPNAQLFTRAAGGRVIDTTTAFLLQYGFERRGVELAAIFLGALGVVVVGCLDDRYELRPRAKFAGQFCVALLVALSGVRITLFVPNLLFSYAVTVLWIVTLINAFNFMDNMNGLCAGLGAIGAWCFAVIAAADGQYLVTLVALLTCGGLVGFLPYNFPKAKAFLGDAGSHLVGYLLAVLAILPHFYTPHRPRHWAVLMPILVLGVPLFDMAWVVLLRWRIGQPFYQGDTNHLSHRLVRAGLSQTRAVLLIWLTAAFLGLICLL